MPINSVNIDVYAVRWWSDIFRLTVKLSKLLVVVRLHGRGSSMGLVWKRTERTGGDDITYDIIESGGVRELKVHKNSAAHFRRNLEGRGKK